jgi:hypothetical protein
VLEVFLFILLCSGRRFFGLCYNKEFVSSWSLLSVDPNYIAQEEG